MRVLGLDLGQRRIGLAISDEEQGIAFPSGVLERRDPEQDLAALRALIAEREVGCVVVGLPIHMSGRAGEEAEGARRFAAALGAATGLPVELLDERWTTREAERRLAESGRAARRRRRAGRGAVDAMAAALILQTYLDRRRSARASEGRG